MSEFPEKVFLNGEVLDTHEAKVSVFDRGFLFGDGVYEVMIGEKGQFFCKEAHLKRLAESLKKVSIRFDLETLYEPMNLLLDELRPGDETCLFYIQITRGVAPRKHSFPKTTVPTVMMYALPLAMPSINRKRIAATTMEDYRWHRCDIKMTSLLGNVMVNDFAQKANAYEAVLVRNGVVTEGSHTNVFFVKGETVYTHPAGVLILNGITRRVVIGICKELNLMVKEEAVKAQEILQMDEAFLTGTTTKVVSIKQMDEHFFYEGTQAGPVTQKIQEAFARFEAQGRSI